MSLFSGGQTYYWAGSGVSYFNVAPVRGGIIAFGANSRTGFHEVGYFAAPNFTTRVVVDDGVLSNSSFTYGIGHVFGDGRFFVLALVNASGQFLLLKRYKINTDNTVSPAGSLVLAAGAFVAQINDKLMAVHNGSAFGIYDMSIDSASLSSPLTRANPFGPAQANRYAMPVGRDCLVAADGAYKWDGAALSKVATASAFTFSAAITSHIVIDYGDGLPIQKTPPGSSDTVFFFDAAFGQRNAQIVSGVGYSSAGAASTEIFPMGGGAAFVSNAFCYLNGATYGVGFMTNTTEITRVAAGGIGVSNLGGK